MGLKGEDLITIDNLSKSFGRKIILDKVSLSINKGEFVGLVGPSGVGKTVFIKMLIGFYTPNSGKMSFLSDKVKNLIGFSMQNNAIYGDLTLIQNLNYFGKVYGLKRKERKEKVELLLNNLELKEYRNIRVNKLSGGTKKRVDIACSLMNNPEILILDEPFLGLDPLLVGKISGFLKKLNKNNGTTIILSSHYLFELGELCNRFLSFKDKKIIEIKKEDLWRFYKNAI